MEGRNTGTYTLFRKTGVEICRKPFGVYRGVNELQLVYGGVNELLLVYGGVNDGFMGLLKEGAAITTQSTSEHIQGSRIHAPLAISRIFAGGFLFFAARGYTPAAPTMRPITNHRRIHCHIFHF